MTYELRPYQERVMADLWAWFGRHPAGHPVIEACVGAGKSILIAELCRRALAWPETRIVMAVASKELCAQNLDKLLRIWPDAPAGVHSASLKRADLGHSILYGTIGSIYKKAHLLGDVSLLLVDECHNISHKDQGMYRQLIRDLLLICPRMRVIGWTGTAFRGDGVWLTDSDEPLFTHVASRVTMQELLEAGYLAPLVPATTTARIDATGVKVVGGDYVVSQLAERADQHELVEACAHEIIALGTNRNRWLVFAVTIAHAEHVCAALRARGVDARCVTSKTPADERDASIRDFNAGRLRCLVNVAVLTTGFDSPAIDFIALLRNTRSPVLYVQMMGRGMRIADGKADCLVADFTGTVEVLGPVDAVKGRARSPRSGQPAPFKVCPECGSQNATASSVCADCGYEFPPPERINHSDTPSGAAMLSSQVVVQFSTYDVSEVSYAIHKKVGSPDSLRVDYFSGLRRVASEWVCLGHEGYALIKAMQWWRARLPKGRGFELVTSAEEAKRWIDHGFTLRVPSQIVVDERGKYPQIISHIFEQEKEHACAA